MNSKDRRRFDAMISAAGIRHLMKPEESKNRITSFLEGFLNEAKIDTVLAQSKLPDEDKAKIRELNDQLTNKTKYIPYLMKNYEAENIVELINNFEANVNKLPADKKDIFKYSVVDLEDLLKNPVQSKTDVKKEIMKDAEKIYEDDELTVWVPKSYEASCKIGAGTKWCTASKDTKQHWDSYTGRRIKFYYVLNKKLKPYDHATGEGDPLYKVAIAVYPDSTDERPHQEVYDATDKQIELPSFIQ